MPAANPGKWLVVAGLVLVGVGLLVWGLGRFLPFGQLPGDVRVERGRWSFYFPIVSGLVLSVILTILLNLFLRWKK